MPALVYSYRKVPRGPTGLTCQGDGKMIFFTTYALPTNALDRRILNIYNLPNIDAGTTECETTSMHLHHRDGQAQRPI